MDGRFNMWSSPADSCPKISSLTSSYYSCYLQVHSNLLYPPNSVFGVRGSDIDKYSRVIFPVIFVAFHITYWTLCLSISGQTPPDIVLLE